MHHLPLRQVDLLHGRAGYQHVHDGRYAMGKGDVFSGNQLQQHFRFVAPRIDLLGSQQCHQVGNAPGVDVEHRRHGHVDVTGIDGRLGLVCAQSPHDAVSVQHQLAVAEVNPFGPAGGAGRVEGGGPGVFVEIGKLVTVVGFTEQGFVFPLDGQR